MTVTSKQVRALYDGDVPHLVLGDGYRFTRPDLTAYIDALCIETGEEGAPLDRQWGVLARYLRKPEGAPKLDELVEIREAAEAIEEAIRRRDRLVRDRFDRWPAASLARQTGLTVPRIYQINGPKTRKTQGEQT